MTPMKILRESISVSDLKLLAGKQFGYLVKAVVDLERNIMAIGGEMHSDEEGLLLDDGSQQRNLWGINFGSSGISVGGNRHWMARMP